MNDHRTAREFVKGIEQLGFQTVPSQANFVLVRFGQWAGRIKSALAYRNILVRERSDAKGCLRISIGSREQMRKSSVFWVPFARREL